MPVSKRESRTDRLYYFRGTTLQTDDIPIIQYLACDRDGHLVEKVEIYHDARCYYLTAQDGFLSAAPFGFSEEEARWGYGAAAECSRAEFEAMKQLALKLADQGSWISTEARKMLDKGIF